MLKTAKSKFSLGGCNKVHKVLVWLECSMDVEIMQGDRRNGGKRI